MKATKKIVGAACALVAAVALSAGSTFAWFTSNGTVKATGLTIDVNTSNSYLVIGNEVNELRPASPEDTSFAYKTDIYLTPTSADGTAGTAVKLLPAAYIPEDYVQLTDLVDAENQPITDPFSATTLDEKDDTCITNVSQWYTGEGTSPTNGALKGDKKTIVEADFSKYVVMDDIYISVAQSSDAVDEVLMTVAPATGSSWGTDEVTNKSNEAINVVLLWQTVTFNGTGEGTYAEWTMKELKGNAAQHSLTSQPIGGVSETTYIHVKVMVYLDGNNAAVKSANAKYLRGVALDFTFTDGGDSGTGGGAGGAGGSD